ncbi:EAL domain-containing protein [Amphritea sp. HPY]|uniref:EAL domain-containing protein n=1 Tax=Amphritea sp. HPY TaxID=3421652 RepID=UPI003D7E471B
MKISSSMEKLTIAKKFSLPLTFFVISLTFISLTFAVFFADLNNRNKVVIDLTLQKNILSRLEASLAYTNEELIQIIYFKNYENDSVVLSLAEDFQSLLTEFREIARKNEFISDVYLADEVEPVFDKLRIDINRILSLTLNDKMVEAVELFNGYYLNDVKRSRKFVNEAFYGKSEFVNELLLKNSKRKIQFAVIFVFEFLVSLLIMFLLHRKIAKQIINPINDLKDSSDAIVNSYLLKGEGEGEGEGEGSYTKVSSYLKKTDSRDEIGVLTQHFAGMLETIESRNAEVLKAKETAENANKQLELLATYDPLTNLYNRRMLTEHIQHAIALAERNCYCFGLFYFDLDDFKKINDIYGHGMGDQLLVKVSERLGGLIRESDILARMGGDEFVLLAQSEVDSLSTLTALAGRIIKMFESAFYVGEQTFYVSCSIGIAIYPDGGKTPGELIQNADVAMYKAKDEGRSCYRYYSTQMSEKLIAQLDIENSIRKALKDNEFTLYYQPKVNPATKEIIGAEVLIRWVCPERGVISPAEFIPVAEQSNLIICIGKWVREQVCRQLVIWKENSFPLLNISVNVSGKEFMKGEIVKHLTELLMKYDVDQKLLNLEITENTLIESREKGSLDFEVIRDMDIGISIDDFGTGYCSLGYLKSYPVGTLKIDKSFIDNITENERDASIVKAIITMAHSLDMSVVAEGVETSGQNDFLLENGCDQIQGYYYSRPLPVDQFEDLVLSYNIAELETG